MTKILNTAQSTETGVVNDNATFSTLTHTYESFTLTRIDEDELFIPEKLTSFDQIIVGKVKLKEPLGNASVQLSLLDWLCIITAFGDNHSVLKFNRILDSVTGQARETLITDLVAAFESQDFSKYFVGSFLEKFMDMLGVSDDDFLALTGLPPSSLVNTKKNQEPSFAVYKSLISLFRFKATIGYANAPFLQDQTVSNWKYFRQLKDRFYELVSQIDFKKGIFEKGNELGHVSYHSGNRRVTFKYGSEITFDPQFFIEPDLNDPNYEVSIFQHRNKKAVLNQLYDQEVYPIRQFYAHELHSNSDFSFDENENCTFKINEMVFVVSKAQVISLDEDELASELVKSYDQTKKEFQVKTRLKKTLLQLRRHYKAVLPESLKVVNAKTGRYKYIGNHVKVSINIDDIKPNMTKNEVNALITSLDVSHKNQLNNDVYKFAHAIKNNEVVYKSFDSLRVKFGEDTTLLIDDKPHNLNADGDVEVVIKDKVFKISQNHLRLFFFGYRTKLYSEFGVTPDSIDAFDSKMNELCDHFNLVKIFSEKPITGYMSQNDSPTDFDYTKPLSQGLFNSLLPLKSRALIKLVVNGEEVSMSVLDLIELHSGICYPVSFDKLTSFEYGEQNFLSIDLICQQILFNNPLYASTWSEVVKRLKIKKNQIKNIRYRDFEMYFDKQYNDTVIGSWFFLNLTYAANAALDPTY